MQEHATNRSGRSRPLRAGRIRYAVSLPAVFLLLAFLSSCGDPAKPAVVAVVNGEAVASAELADRLASESARWGGPAAVMGNRDAVKDEVLQELIQEKLMLQRARALSLSITEEELDREAGSLAGGGRPGTGVPPSWRDSLRRQILIRKLIRQDLYETITVAPGEAEAYYRKNRDAYRIEDRVRALQIVLREPRRISAVRNRLKKGEDFGKVAREESVGPEAPKGGDLGFCVRGSLPDAIDRVVFTIPVGEISPPIRTPYGYHIVKVLQREGGKPPDYPAAREQVIEDLRKAKAEAAYGGWMETLQKSARVEIRAEVLRKIRVPENRPATPKPEPPPLRDTPSERR
ncbi:MAG: hypothetical protein HPY65_11105 [Syntrophaceae bacterium]|nr:hypothetical protein [Syntrophaceae bacterium]